MQIVSAQLTDLPVILSIYEHAKAFMVANGNAGQWADGYPQPQLIASGIEQRHYYLGVDAGEVVAAFYFAVESEPTYQRIDGGQWLNELPYGVLHRIAVRSSKKGVASFCLQWCFAQTGNMRIDTHENNLPMRRVLEKNGYRYCGVIYVRDGSPRLAFQKTC
ncbi:GNAT family N-acetyltransferase [Shewanella dokdonensis]|uniref:GNAT family N-acetyltransferase n=1 Tax=Shewanella dokdonensis TaxID=712036 RepID=A0ABX8DED3_9GAMM|nr:GNAT family N-acetyltransferase [Shewanella dokdonensis]MCL1075466.1 GNAT family N-acetyltransferase [Shewanella dokdonensis]QVK22147.1 GNAT family N-acetyltransferase [Shewanella dokdonensis]